MSLRSKSELTLRLGHRQVELALWQGRWWSRRCTLRLRAAGSGRAALDMALARAQAHLSAQGADLPARADLVIDDDCVYYALVEAGWRWPQARAQAEAHFAEVFGPEAPELEMTLAPGGRHWIAAALEAAVIDPWLAALDERGIETGRIGVALLEDLAARPAIGAGLIVLLREQGALVLGLQRGALVRLEWLRLDWHDSAVLQTRLAAQQTPDLDDGLVLLPDNPAQHALLEPLARSLGWQLRPARLALQPADGAALIELNLEATATAAGQGVAA